MSELLIEKFGEFLLQVIMKKSHYLRPSIIAIAGVRARARTGAIAGVRAITPAIIFIKHVGPLYLIF